MIFHGQMAIFRIALTFFLFNIFWSGLKHRYDTIYLSLETPNPGKNEKLHFFRFSSYVVRRLWYCMTIFIQPIQETIAAGARISRSAGSKKTNDHRVKRGRGGFRGSMAYRRQRVKGRCT